MERHPWILPLLLCLPALVPTLQPGWFQGHDDLHVFRLVEYDLVVRDGQLPPRWFPDISAGFGNPHPNFYAPLFYLVAELFHLTGLGVLGSLKGAIVVFMLVAAAAMYRYARLFWNPGAAVVAAVAYTYAPYHLLDLYVRKSLSEFTVFAFLPLLLLSLHRLSSRGSRRDIAVAALSLAAVSMSHTIAAMMVPVLAAPYVALLSVNRGADGWLVRWRLLGKVAVALVIGYAMAGFYLVPAFLERETVNLDIYTGTYFDYGTHFVYLRQLIWWPWGFGLSWEGLDDEMSFRLGLLQIAGSVIALAGFGALRQRSPAGSRHVLFFVGLAAVAVFLMLPISSGVWGVLPLLKFVQFPWRFLIVTALSTAFLCGAAFEVWVTRERIPAFDRMRRREMVMAIAVGLTFVVAALAGGMLEVGLRVPDERIGYEARTDADIPYFILIDRGADEMVQPIDAAYVRRHTLLWIDHLPGKVTPMDRTDLDLARPRVEVDEGTALIEDLEEGTDRVSFRVVADGPARLRLNTYYFPGWTVLIEGDEVPLLEPPEQDPVLFFTVGSGEHRVTAVLRDTWPRRLGNWMSAIGLLVIVVLGVWPGSSKPSAGKTEKVSSR